MPEGPDFIGVGVQKCATTWVGSRLAEHPQVDELNRKEISFWTHHFHKGYDWYNAHFAGKGERIAGEISPNYLFTPRPAPARLEHYPRWSFQSFIQQLLRPHPPARDEIKRVYPHCKVFAVFRNPADRAWSQYWMWVERREKRGKGRLVVPFEKMFRDNGRWIRQHGHYATHLKYWREAFPDMGVFLFEDLVADAQGFMASVYRFVGIDDTFVGNLEQRENARRHEPLDDGRRRMMLESYRGEIEEFFGLIGRRLDWLDPLG